MTHLVVVEFSPSLSLAFHLLVLLDLLVDALAAREVVGALVRRTREGERGCVVLLLEVERARDLVD